ncbi:oligosaccharide flippase family protein [Candidatus Fermentibacteria bacterium]|nr:oligosaccharide flippase family protein [Candidatus Fermentibacteria bacterium]
MSSTVTVHASVRLFRLEMDRIPYDSSTNEGFLTEMQAFSYLLNARKNLLKIGFPALISRGTMAIWGILIIFIIRSLPSDMYAVFAVGKSLSMFGVLLGGGFFQMAILKLAAEGGGIREQQLANAGILLSLCFAFGAGILIISGGDFIASFYEQLDISGIPFLIALVVITGIFNGLPRILLLTRHRTNKVMVTDLVHFAAKGGIIVFLLVSGRLRTAHQIFTATIISNLISFILNAWYARDLFHPTVGINLQRVKKVFSFALVFMGSSIAGIIYTSTDILMLGKLDPEGVAPYGAARSLSGLVLVVTQAAKMIVIPYISRVWSQGNRQLVKPRIWSTILLAEILILPTTLLFILFPRPLLDIVFSGKYTDHWQILLILGALSVVRPFGSIFAAASSAVGKPQYSMYSVIISAIVNVTLNIWLIPKYGAIGAAIATSTAVVMGSSWIVYTSMKYINSHS